MAKTHYADKQTYERLQAEIEQRSKTSLEGWVPVPAASCGPCDALFASPDGRLAVGLLLAPEDNNITVGVVNDSGEALVKEYPMELVEAGTPDQAAVALAAAARIARIAQGREANPMPGAPQPPAPVAAQVSAEGVNRGILQSARGEPAVVPQVRPVVPSPPVAPLAPALYKLLDEADARVYEIINALVVYERQLAAMPSTGDPAEDVARQLKVGSIKNAVEALSVAKASTVRAASYLRFI